MTDKGEIRETLLKLCSEQLIKVYLGCTLKTMLLKLQQSIIMKVSLVLSGPYFVDYDCNSKSVDEWLEIKTANLIL